MINEIRPCFASETFQYRGDKKKRIGNDLRTISIELPRS